MARRVAEEARAGTLRPEQVDAAAIEDRLWTAGLPPLELVVRTSGEVGPCCILQGKPLGNVYRDSLQEVWNGEAYERFRRELKRIMREGDGWSASPDEQFVEGLCGGRTAACPIANFYFRYDAKFMDAYQRVLQS